MAGVVLRVCVADLNEPFAALHGYAAMLSGLGTRNRMHILFPTLTAQKRPKFAGVPVGENAIAIFHDISHL